MNAQLIKVATAVRHPTPFSPRAQSSAHFHISHLHFLFYISQQPPQRASASSLLRPRDHTQTHHTR